MQKHQSIFGYTGIFRLTAAYNFKVANIIQRSDKMRKANYNLNILKHAKAKAKEACIKKGDK